MVVASGFHGDAASKGTTSILANLPNNITFLDMREKKNQLVHFIPLNISFTPLTEETRGLGFRVFFQLCDVATLVIIHNRN
jgi:hypothetical protein